MDSTCMIVRGDVESIFAFDWRSHVVILLCGMTVPSPGEFRALAVRAVHV
jgi:hypothetical protein